MNKIFASMLLLASPMAYADPDPYMVTVRQRTADDTGYLDRFVLFPTSGPSCLFSLDYPSLVPSCYTLGSGLQLSGTVISVTAGGGQMQSDWSQANTSSADYIKNKPATYAPSAHNQAWSTITNTPTTLAGYGISDAATSASVTSLLAGKQNTLSLTTTGSGAATLVGATLNIPTPSAAPLFNYSAPAAKAVVANTSYQATDPTKAAIVTISPACTNNTTVLASSACTLQVRQSNAAGLTCSTGTVQSTWTSTVNLGLVFTAGNGFPFDVKLPIGGYFIVCPTAGTFTISAVEQSAG